MHTDDPPDDYDAARNSAESYTEAIAAIRERVRAGAPEPSTGYFRPAATPRFRMTAGGGDAA